MSKPFQHKQSSFNQTHFNLPDSTTSLDGESSYDISELSKDMLKTVNFGKHLNHLDAQEQSIENNSSIPFIDGLWINPTMKEENTSTKNTKAHHSISFNSQNTLERSRFTQSKSERVEDNQTSTHKNHSSSRIKMQIAIPSDEEDVNNLSISSSSSANNQDVETIHIQKNHVKNNSFLKNQNCIYSNAETQCGNKNKTNHISKGYSIYNPNRQSMSTKAASLSYNHHGFYQNIPVVNPVFPYNHTNNGINGNQMPQGSSNMCLSPSNHYNPWIYQYNNSMPTSCDTFNPGFIYNNQQQHRLMSSKNGMATNLTNIYLQNQQLKTSNNSKYCLTPNSGNSFCRGNGSIAFINPIQAPWNTINSKIDSTCSNSNMGTNTNIIKKPQQTQHPSQTRPKSKSEKIVNKENSNEYLISIEDILTKKEERTTIMIKHIHPKYTTSAILEEIDKRLELTTEKIYDVFYLPQSFKKETNLGYAFINFISPLHVINFYIKFKGSKWECYNTNKEIDIYFAKFQGKTNFINHLKENSGDEKKPIILETSIWGNIKIKIPKKYMDLIWKFHSDIVDYFEFLDSEES